MTLKRGDKVVYISSETDADGLAKQFKGKVIDDYPGPFTGVQLEVGGELVLLHVPDESLRLDEVAD